MYTFVTSFNKDGYENYAEKMLNSVQEKWNPEHFRLIAYYHDFDIEEVSPPVCDTISYRNLNDIEEMLDYRERMKKHDGTEGGTIKYSWRHDAIKWCHKVYAMTDLALEMMDREIDQEAPENNWMIWLDADTIADKRLDVEKVAEWLPNEVDIVHLGRKNVTKSFVNDYSETSFMGFNLAYHNTCSLLADLPGAYTIGEVTAYREWHDGFIFERLLNIYKAHGMKVKNLTPHVNGLDAFTNSPLSEYFTHYKGDLKSKLSDTQVSPDVSDDVYKRYKQLLTLVQAYKPKTIVETGTWNGGRAIKMAAAALKDLDEVHYIGFDLFEDATPEVDKIEINSKPHNTVAAVTQRLQQFADEVKKAGKTFTFELHKGDTKETLPACKGIKDADLAFIDGGHSLETVRNDYDLLKHVDVVVFDDYYSSKEEEIREDRLGTIKVFEEINTDKKYILPSDDKTVFDNYIHLCVVLTEEADAIPPQLLKIPIVVKPKDSMPQDDIQENIIYNVEKIKNFDWVKQYKSTNKHAIIASGGQLDFDKLREVQEKYDAEIWCVKHSYPRLLEAGFKPHACVILDPRPVDGISTHGIKRKDLFKTVDPDTMFVIASMTDTSAVDYIMSKTDNVRGFHAFTDAVRDTEVKDKFVINPKLPIPAGSVFVSGGTASATRTIGLLETLGYRNIHLFGFDCSVPEEAVDKEAKDEQDNAKYLNVETGGVKFWTTGELLELAQDLEKMFEKKDISLNIDFYGEDTLAAQVFKQSFYNKEFMTFEEFMQSDAA